jgi:antitoxin ParD1/3/4
MGTDEGESAIDLRFMVSDDVLRRKIQEAYDDSRPSIPAEEVFEDLRRRHAERMKERNATRPTR